MGLRGARGGSSRRGGDSAEMVTCIRTLHVNEACAGGGFQIKRSPVRRTVDTNRLVTTEICRQSGIVGKTFSEICFPSCRAYLGSPMSGIPRSPINRGS